MAPPPVAEGADGADWMTSLRQMALAARTVILSHPWAPPVIESRTTPGPAALRYINTVLGVLRGGGFSVAQTHHALHILGSRMLGFSQDNGALGGCDDDGAFRFALDFILDGLAGLQRG
jgi:hypothetical protein